jgi:phospholipid/cholesterol/gamma-HCH transport system permease protein
MGRTFSRPERMRMFMKQYVREMEYLGVGSIGIVLLISFFIGAVVCIQIKLNIQSSWMPNWVPGYTTREIMLLEFSSAIMCLILAGKVGSNIASEIGTMRTTQQIDALEIMGVNSAAYLILPKIVATVLFFPLLAMFSMMIGTVGGYLIAYFTGIVLPAEYVEGLHYYFIPFEITYSLIKMAVFAFIITSISAFYGYSPKGNSLEVGRASTRAVVTSSITIMIFNLILTQLMLT